ncbi:putative reverse transcriptase domain-containing protein [Tanacetum coccineum]
MERGFSCLCWHKSLQKRLKTESETKRLNRDVPIDKDFPEVFLRTWPMILPPTHDNGVSNRIAPVPHLGSSGPCLSRRKTDHSDEASKSRKSIVKIIVELLKKESCLQNTPNLILDPPKKQFLGPRLAGYYRRFIEGFSKIAKPMTKLTQKKVKFEWGDKQEAAFKLLKQKLCSAPILALPEGSEDFIAYYDASKKGLGAVLMQREKVISYASRQLKMSCNN